MKLFITLLAIPLAFAARKPDNIPGSIWVREDLFAGYLSDDVETFNRGEQKLDEILAANPKDPTMLSWKFGAELYRAIRIYEAGDAKEFRKRYDGIIARFDALTRKYPKHQAVLAIRPGMIAAIGHRLPPELQVEANRQATTYYLKLEEEQKATLDKMPVHHRGEVLGGIAQSAARSDQDELARTYLARLIESLPGTAYASIAANVLKKPELMKTAKIACNSCHEPNRLANFTKRLEAQ